VSSWDERVASFWKSADDTQPELMMKSMRDLVEQCPADDPDALYEWASVHDFLGHEEQAVALYQAALAAGLSGEREPQEIVQLASSLRNIGNPKVAVEILTGREFDVATVPGAQAFLALALRDCGRHDEALQVSLLALARTLPLYQRAVVEYAQSLKGANEKTGDAVEFRSGSTSGGKR